MNKTNPPDRDLEKLLGQTLRDDLPPDLEARMSRQFLNLQRHLEQPENLIKHDPWLWIHGAFRKGILSFISATLLILGGVLHVGGYHSVLAHSLERLKMVVAVSAGLHRATSMDCTVLQHGTGGETFRYRIRWSVTGGTRVDMDSGSGTWTLWVSGTDLPSERRWQPVLEFLTPAILAQHVEQRYGLMKAERPDPARADEWLLVGLENRQAVEIAVDERTFLPKTLTKCGLDSGLAASERGCLMEVQFQWNQPIPRELLIPGTPAKEQLIKQ
jgi:hypothetical protein